MQRVVYAFVVLTVSLLLGCSSMQRKKPAVVESFANASEYVAPVKYASFESETLYDLLVAELSAQQGRYDLMLANYLKQAHKTRDRGVAERSYLISQYLGVQQAALDSAVLWASVDPQSSAALQASAFEWTRAGNLELALEQMGQALALGSEVHFDFLAVHAANLSKKQHESLQKALDNLLKKHPDHPSLLLGKAILFVQTSELDQALKLCERLLKQSPDEVRAIILKARILNKSGQSAEAETLLAAATKKKPDSVRLRLTYARILIHREKYQAAKDQFEQLYRDSPYDHEVLLSLALISLELELRDESRGYFEKLLEGPKADTARYYLGRMDKELGEWDSAIAHFESVQPGGEFMLSRIELAQILVSRGEINTMQSRMERDRNRYPSVAVELYLLETEILLGISQFEQATVILTQGILLHPENFQMLYGRALIHIKVGRLSEFERDMRAILASQPDNIEALNALGYTLADQTDRLEEAAVLIERAYTLNKSDPAILDSMGWVQYRLGNNEKALSFLLEAYRHYPDAEVAAHLGEVLWKLGRRDEARHIWNQAASKASDNTVLQKTRDRFLDTDHDEITQQAKDVSSGTEMDGAGEPH